MAASQSYLILKEKWISFIKKYSLKKNPKTKKKENKRKRKARKARKAKNYKPISLSINVEPYDDFLYSSPICEHSRCVRIRINFKIWIPTFGMFINNRVTRVNMRLCIRIESKKFNEIFLMAPAWEKKKVQIAFEYCMLTKLRLLTRQCPYCEKESRDFAPNVISTQYVPDCITQLTTEKKLFVGRDLMHV